MHTFLTIVAVIAVAGGVLAFLGLVLFAEGFKH